MARLALPGAAFVLLTLACSVTPQSGPRPPRISPEETGAAQSTTERSSVATEATSPNRESAALTPLVQDAMQFPGAHSALVPAGPQAAHIHVLWRFMWLTSAVVWGLVVFALLYGTFHSRQPQGSTTHDGQPPRGTAGMRNAVVGATALTTLMLFLFLLVDFRVGRGLTLVSPHALQIQVIGHQWWWEVHYPASESNQIVTTANEIHVPVGRPVVLQLRSTDVIHSFWAPNLVGKRDLIPGHLSGLWFQADRAGVYRGQCAEFCGYQHAKMAFTIVAEPAEEFGAWMARQRDSARTPSEDLARRGQQVFLSSSCVTCHSIQGTPAGSRVGPDLTHLASRETIAAGTLRNTRGNTAGWILDPQRIKPGTQMPPTRLSPKDLLALLVYLESLK